MQDRLEFDVDLLTLAQNASGWTPLTLQCRCKADGFPENFCHPPSAPAALDYVARVQDDAKSSATLLDSVPGKEPRRLVNGRETLSAGKPRAEEAQGRGSQ